MCNEQAIIDAALLKAVEDNDLPAVTAQLARGANVNVVDEDGETALQLAMDDDCYDIIELLVNAGADINFRSRHDETPLISALAYGHSRTARLFVLKGAEVNVCGADFDDGMGPQSPLMLAAIDNNVELGRLLLEHGAKPDQFADSEGETPLHLAAWGGHADFAQLLLDYGADITLRMCALGSSDTAFEIALRGKNEDCARVLFAAVQAHSPDILGTLLHAAAYLGDFMLAETLLVHGVEPRDYLGKTPLHWAVGKQQPQLPLLILNCAGLASRGKRTVASQKNSIKFLLSRGANVDARDANNSTPLLDALGWSQIGAAEQLIECGANVNTSDDAGWTALHLASSKHIEFVSMLLNQGANINAVRLQDWNALTFAIHTNQIKVAELLLERGATVSASTLRRAAEQQCSVELMTRLEYAYANTNKC